AEILLWPFVGAKGPMGKQAEVLSANDKGVVSLVAARPRSAGFAAGYDDGAVRLFDVGTGDAVTVTEPCGSPTTALAWSADGRVLGLGREDGSAEVLTASPQGPS
ncbi:MAG: hypothetical protein K2Q06_02825, partial [Parvularculaceae bacterium]|nr:hypothetical protein [Parvularculaceae bacterium]